VSTLSQLISKHGKLPNADVEWLNLLIGDWQMVADLVNCDLVLWVQSKDEKNFIAVSHARPSSAGTIFYRDIVGENPSKLWGNQVNKAFTKGIHVDLAVPDIYDGISMRIRAVPVRRRLKANINDFSNPIAVVTVHTNLSEVREPTKQRIHFRQVGNELLDMIEEGTYPDFQNTTGSTRGAPRANDGLVILDEEATVTFASPNALSAFNRFGVAGELVGLNLQAAVEKTLGKELRSDEDLAVVLNGKAPWRADAQTSTMTLSLRAVPLKKKHLRTGAIVLCRDISELRRQERELITKDATIREIHHRVKNNLQTVASLLRIQSRRSDSEEVKEALDQAMRRVAAIALVHDTLAAGLSQDVNFDEVFDRVLKLTTEVNASAGTTVNTIIDGKFGALPSEKATSLAVSITELVTNAVEHGLAERSGVVHINAERKGKKLTVTISDNGNGLPEGKLQEGLGTSIVKTLIEGELRGSINWFSPKEGGTKVVVEIPLS
jgi:two-component sensor histidine kinase